MNTTTSKTKTEERKILKKVNQGLKESRKVALVNAPKPLRRVAKAAVQAKGPPRESHLSRWAKALAFPFDCMGAICPVNFNPAPSLMSTTVRLTHTNLTLSVAAGSTTQLTIFPGHGKPASSIQSSSSLNQIMSDMDGVAYHSQQYSGAGSLLLNAGNWHVGATNTSDAGGNNFTGFNVLYNSGLATGGSTNGVAASASVGFYDNAAPYASSIKGHLRWQMVSCGVRIFNTTPQLSRGGNIVSVQLTNNLGFVRQDGVAATTQAQLEMNPTFKIFGDGGDGVEISWIPRLQDLAYWHSIVTTNSPNVNFVADSYESAAMGIYLNNNTSAAQTYAVQMVFNFMIAGTSVQAISNPAVVEPILRAPIEQTVVHLANTSSTARTAPFVAEAASSSPREGQSMFEKLSGKAYQMAMHGAHAVGEGIVHGVLNRNRGGPEWGVLVPRRH